MTDQTCETDEIRDLLDRLETAAKDPWCNRPDAPWQTGITLTDHDRDPVGSLDCAETLEAIEQIRNIIERCDNALAALDHIIEGT